jgi:hypothetical protein
LHALPARGDSAAGTPPATNAFITCRRASAMNHSTRQDAGAANGIVLPVTGSVGAM